MAFLNKLGSLVRQSISQNGQVPMASMVNTIRCMSSSRLFVGGLAWSIDDQTLRDAFSNFGEVTDARVVADRHTGRSRGFGYVSFESNESADEALSAMDGQDLGGRYIRVSHANEWKPYNNSYSLDQRVEVANEWKPYNNSYGGMLIISDDAKGILNVPITDFMGVFEKEAKQMEADGEDTHTSFFIPSISASALDLLPVVVLGLSNLFQMAFVNKLGSLVRQSISQNGQVPMASLLNSIRCMSSSKLFIGGLSWSTDDQTLKDAFSNFGEVTEARVITDRDTGRSRGFGFVSFESNESADEALSAMDGQVRNRMFLREFSALIPELYVNRSTRMLQDLGGRNIRQSDAPSSLTDGPGIRWGSTSLQGPREEMEDDIVIRSDGLEGFSFVAVFDGHCWFLFCEFPQV
ncbi:unnamed protein product [Dovyalis caffra]|uniref:RRM domain-containing protein n=1 Tax=Dovyalis caffra TaxID=77055 RepID=A0AAV1R330_9ROSI|nr:unnamed protein product [Dovyalis caffra]